MASGGHDPAQLLRWIIKETAEPKYTDNGQEQKSDNNNEQKESIPVTKLEDLDPAEKKKWTDIILGQTPDILNNRVTLKQSINQLHKIKDYIVNIKDFNAKKMLDPNPKLSDNEVRKQWGIGSKCEIYSESNKTWFSGEIIKIIIDSEGEWLLIGYRTNEKEERTQQIQRDSKSILPIIDNSNDNSNDSNEANEEIKNCLEIVHILLDKNEAVLAKLNGIPLLLEMMNNSINKDNSISVLCCTILHDSSQNNPMMQNHIYSVNGIAKITKILSNTHKYQYKFRAKLWALIHVICRDHNPNFNVFLSNGGYHKIVEIRIEQNNLNDELLKEILRVSRLLNYMFAVWTDGNSKVFERLNLLKWVNWTIFSLHHYVIGLVSISSDNNKLGNNKSSRLRTSQIILDILMELVGGIRMFIKRDDQCKKFIIGNKENKDITIKLKQLQNDLGVYCKQHRPKLIIDETKNNRGKSYRFRYYLDKNDIDNNKNELNIIDEEKETKDDNNTDDQSFYAMKDIWNTIQSIIRHVNRYENNRKQQMKMQEIWRKTLPKHKRDKYLNQYKNNNKNKISTSSSSPPPSSQSINYQLVLFKNKQNDNDNDDYIKKKSLKEKGKQNRKKRNKHNK